MVKLSSLYKSISKNLDNFDAAVDLANMIPTKTRNKLISTANNIRNHNAAMLKKYRTFTGNGINKKYHIVSNDVNKRDNLAARMMESAKGSDKMQSKQMFQDNPEMRKFIK